jgi:L-ectoine synthase
MILRTIEAVLNSKNNVESDNWASRRFLVKKDGIGFSLSETTIYAGSETEIWYKTMPWTSMTSTSCVPRRTCG